MFRIVLLFISVLSYASAETMPVTLTKFVAEMTTLLQPKEVRYIGFSPEDKEILIQESLIYGEACVSSEQVVLEREQKEVQALVATPFNDEGYLYDEWIPEDKASKKVLACLERSFHGRTLYVLPYCLGVIGSDYCQGVVQVTDSPFLALRTLNKAQTGREVLPLFEKGPFIRSIHCSTSMQEPFLIRFPHKREIWTYGEVSFDQIQKTLVSFPADRWIASSFSLFSLTDPEGEKKYGLLLHSEEADLSRFQQGILSGWRLEFLGLRNAWIFVREGVLMALSPEIDLSEAAEEPIAMIVICGNKRGYPLLCEASSWKEGVFMATLFSRKETKSFDPFGMRQQVGGTLGGYLQKWVDLSEKPSCRFFTINCSSDWSMDSMGSLLKWCFERCSSFREAQETSLGFMPLENDLDIELFDSCRSYKDLFTIERPFWIEELMEVRLFLRPWEHILSPELVSGRVFDILSNGQVSEEI